MSNVIIQNQINMGSKLLAVRDLKNMYRGKYGMTPPLRDVKEVIEDRWAHFTRDTEFLDLLYNKLNPVKNYDPDKFRIFDLWNTNGKKIDAIKFLRNQCDPGVCLKLAKDTVKKLDGWMFPDTELIYMAMMDAGYMISEADRAVERYQKNPLLFGEEPKPETETYMGEIIAWRAFTYMDQKLSPLTLRKVDFTTFGLNVDTAPEPEEHNPYGFWGFKEKKNLLNYHLVRDQYVDDGKFGISVVFATIKLGGIVIEHENGYRASEFEILGLYSKLNNSQRRGIAHKLGWPGKVLPIEKGQNFYEPKIIQIPNTEG